MPLVWVYLKPVVVPVYPKIIAAMDLEGWLRGQTPLPPPMLFSNLYSSF